MALSPYARLLLENFCFEIERQVTLLGRLAVSAAARGWHLPALRAFVLDTLASFQLDEPLHGSASSSEHLRGTSCSPRSWPLAARPPSFFVSGASRASRALAATGHW